ncbi:lipoyl(octanoyl) transferase LipB [Desulforhopalus singaporensis]|uniref:Octanoyltransferase n=1 Tax=Desulforhopalus singaporensis TaxID=91360 RepID=A0A1H0PTG7_9BACT|nr:lipoyl(octanoyl) transferase LipB [Desulforhopalus singaporensis]SDP08100.1 lipoyl(octanoyl) transferase [Desulforhopalus singaporensis]
MSSITSYLVDLGRTDYAAAHQFQLDCVRWRLEDKHRHDVFLVTEHSPVFTLGSRGGRQSLMVSEDHVRAEGVAIVQTERGGDITYHGPGQVVVYPIIHLRSSRLSVREYVHMLEQVMIDVAASYSIAAGRDERNRGIWVGNSKIGSIGIRVRHGVTFHGLALNANLDFTHFNWIQPCGLAGVGVTSLERETGAAIDFADAKQRMARCLGDVFHREFSAAVPSNFSGVFP